MPNTSSLNVENLSLPVNYTSTQGKRFFPITHRKAIMGLSPNTLTLSQSTEIDVDPSTNKITINPLVDKEIKRIDQTINNLDATIRLEIGTNVENLWERVNGLNYAAASSPGGAANSALKLTSPMTLEVQGDGSGTVSFDGSAKAILNLTVAKTQNKYAGADTDGGAATSAKKLSTPRTVSLSGAITGDVEFDGSGDVTIVTNVNHNHDDLYSSISHDHDAVYSKLNHTHNYAGSSSAGGAATSAAKLSAARTIKLTGAVTGSVSFDGSKNVEMATTVNHNHDAAYAAKSHTHAYLPTAGGTVTGNLKVNGSYYQNNTVGYLTLIQSGQPTVTNMLWAW